MKRAAVILLALAASRAHGADLFVDVNRGSDASDGLAWMSARRTVSSALATAAATPGPDSVSVAEGEYHERLVVPPGVTLLGGFPAGGGTADPAAHLTVLDGDFEGTVVRFELGTDDCSIDGFTIRRGRLMATSGGGGMAVLGSSPTVRRCVIERNTAWRGGGAYVERGSPWFFDCIFRNNASQACGAAVEVATDGYALGIPHFVRTVFEDNAGGQACELGRGAIFHVMNAPGGTVPVRDDWVEPDPLLESCLVQRNVSFSPQADIDALPSRVAFYIQERPRLVQVRNTAFRGNITSGFAAAGGWPTDAIRTELFNCEFSGHPGAGLVQVCKSDMGLTNCTLADNGLAVWVEYYSAWTSTSTYMSRCVVADPLDADGGCGFPDVVTDDCLVVGGSRVGTNVLDTDPLFVPGPHGNYALSQVAAGETVNSPVVDLGPVLASDVSLDSLSTRSDGLGDAGLVDWGVHYGPAFGGMLPGGSGLPIDAVEIVRGTNPTDLGRLAVISDLPFTDSPGVLSDASLPLLFYRAQWVDAPIHAWKDLGNDTVVLTY